MTLSPERKVGSEKEMEMGEDGRQNGRKKEDVFVLFVFCSL